MEHVFSLIPNPKFGSFDLKSLWQDSLRRAVFARSLGRAIKLANAEDLFAAALLQDMAIPILLKSLPEQYGHLVERRNNEHLRLSTLEREVFGWDHAEAAAALCRNWRLPEEFATLIERHTALDDLLNAAPPKRDAGCIAIAAMLPSCRDEKWNERDMFLAGVIKIGGASSVTADFIQEVDTTFEDFAPVLQLPVPEKSLAQWIND